MKRCHLAFLFLVTGDLLENGKKYLEGLQEITSDALWRSNIRSAEVDRRLGREPAVKDDLEAVFEVCKPEEKVEGKALLETIATEARQFRLCIHGPCIVIYNMIPILVLYN